MSAIGPGDYVECIDLTDSIDWPPGSEARHRRALARLSVGHVYRVTALGRRSGILLAGVCAADEPDYGFKACRFRPIYRPREEFIQSLLKPIPEEVTA